MDILIERYIRTRSSLIAHHCFYDSLTFTSNTMSFIIEALLALVLLVWLVVSACRRPRNFPPGKYLGIIVERHSHLEKMEEVNVRLLRLGPRGLPLIGYLPFIKRHDPSGVLYKSLKKLSDIYGPVVGFYLGTQPFVSVCGYEAVKEALRHPDLDGRVDTDVIKMRTFGDRLGWSLKCSFHRQEMEYKVAFSHRLRFHWRRILARAAPLRFAPIAWLGLWAQFEWECHTRRD